MLRLGRAERGDGCKVSVAGPMPMWAGSGTTTPDDVLGPLVLAEAAQSLLLWCWRTLDRSACSGQLV